MTAQVCPNGAKRTKHHKQRPMQRTNSIQLLDTRCLKPNETENYYKDTLFTANSRSVSESLALWSAKRPEIQMHRMLL